MSSSNSSNGTFKFFTNSNKALQAWKLKKTQTEPTPAEQGVSYADKVKISPELAPSSPALSAVAADTEDLWTTLVKSALSLSTIALPKIQLYEN
ncbi:hypothetical protein SLS58_004820 [Diplodia intermedia]|uniref:Uncharacterized protein n=1 Tax=Diplodia intermedia TaxID=856260 RepID=A0ABR3TSJ0_9PEZI